MKASHIESYKLFLHWLSSKRLLAGMTQQELSEQLSRPQSFVSKYENTERRLDLIETIEICTALNADPHEIINLLKGTPSDN